MKYIVKASVAIAKKFESLVSKKINVLKSYEPREYVAHLFKKMILKGR